VGALDMFGSRSAMLSILDQIISISSSHFRASDAGQMSMFGAATGLSDEIILPRLAPEANRRELLEWEKELIGLYVSDHPLSPVMDALSQVVTHFSGQLAEANPGDKVRVAGIVTRVRPHTTKTGKSMGFVTLEDVQGTIDLVVFPRTWDQHWQTFEVDRVVLVDGKLDAQGGDPKVLVDSVTSDLKAIGSAPVPPAGEANSQALVARSSEPQPRSHETQPPRSGPKPRSSSAADETALPDEPPEEDDWGEMPPPPDNFPPGWSVDELGGSVSRTPTPTSGDEVPPVGEAGFVLESAISQEQPSGSSSSPMESAAPLSGGAVSTTETTPLPGESISTAGPTSLPVEEVPLAGALEISAMESTTMASLEAAVEETIPEILEQEAAGDLPKTPAAVESVAYESVQEGEEITETPAPSIVNIPNALSDATIAVPPYVGGSLSRAPTPAPRDAVPTAGATPDQNDTDIFGSPSPPYVLPPVEAYAGEELHMITVVLRPGGDKVRDNLRLRQCYGLLISYSGHDRFALQIFEHNRGYRIEFPNYTTTYCPELLAGLSRIIGAENILVEPLRLH
jgi:hypothetical protein